MAQYIQNAKMYKQKMESILNDPNAPWAYALTFIEGKTGIKRIYVVLGLILCIVLYLMFGYAAQLMCNIIGFVYPAYASFKAIESPDKRDDTKWLTYWTVYAFFSIVEFPSDVLLSWFPFYYLTKCIFMIWLFLPISANGSVFLYNSFIRQWFIKHSSSIDDIMNQFSQSATKAAVDIATKSE